MHLRDEWVHSLVDDHARYAYCELHRDEKATTVTAFVERALAAFVQGIVAKRLISDNAWAYTRNHGLDELLARHGLRHLPIPPHRPQVNGKVERFQQTLKREWGLGQVYRSSDHRAQALTHRLRYYNERRPHSSLGGRPPLSRVTTSRGRSPRSLPDVEAGEVRDRLGAPEPRIRGGEVLGDRPQLATGGDHD
jgi:transposase InsO family protein